MNSLKVEAENDAQQEWEHKAAKKAENFRKERAKVRERGGEATNAGGFLDVAGSGRDAI